MECEEEMQGVCSPSQNDADEGLQAGTSPTKGTDPPAVRIIPIPVQPENSCSPATLNHTDNHSGVLPSLKVNGRVVPLLPEGGGGAELNLFSHPRGSASGFTTFQIPITLTVVSPAGSHHINTTASLTAVTKKPATPNPAAALLEPEAAPPIITGVVSGEAAQKVLSDHNVNSKSSPSPKELNTVFHAPTMSTTSLVSPWTIPTASQKTNASPSINRSAGQPDPVSSPDCRVCLSQYKLIMKLRGFMCLCSPLIAQSLKKLKKNKSPRWSRHTKKTSRSTRESHSSMEVSIAQLQVSPKTHTFPDGILSDQITSSTFPTSFTNFQEDQLNLSSHGKLVILVEDLYYGSAQGQSTFKTNIREGKFTGLYHCIHCPMTLCNNLELMSHMKQHVPTMSLEGRDSDSAPSCPHCYRQFLSKFKLQCHLEAVHSQCESTVTCRICELDFGSEVLFLWHMKNTHKPGEMPYVCQVCNFRSSFYSDVWSHFQEAHADTKLLLCQYCLRVLHSNTCYQQHFAQHQKKHIFGCDKCRLHFLYTKERMEHKLLHHRTFIRPPQLNGLKSGTRVTVRTFSVVGGADNREPMKVIPCKVVPVNSPPPPQEAVKRRPVQNLGELLSSLSQETSVRRSRHLCVECQSLVEDFRTHFPSVVHCSLCRFLTCCSTSYANHMISNHASCQKAPQYQSIFQTDPWLSNRLECESCKLCTSVGDLMARHLSERPDHYCKVYTDCSSDEAQQTHSVTSPDHRGRFIPIHLRSCSKTSAQLSIKPLAHPSPLSPPPAMTITFLGHSTKPVQTPACPLSASQLAVVLSSLCHGLSQASYHCQTDAAVIASWTQQLKQGLWSRRWSWKTYRFAQWLLRQREEQLVVSEDVLLQNAKEVLGKESQLVDCYSWAVDFMLRHDAAVQSRNPTTRILLPRNIKEKMYTFIQSLRSQIDSAYISPHHVGCMDEFSIFIDSTAFRDQNPLAFKLFGSPKDKPVFDIVLSALSDGTLLTPLLFFRGTPSQVPEGFPNNVLLEAQQEGFTDQERLHIWINKVWQPHMVVAGRDSPSVLLVDVHRGHQTEKFRDSLSSVSTDVVIIPLGCCCRLQPLDVCVTPVLRDFLQARWAQLVSQGGLDSLGLDKMALTLACWLSEVCSTLNLETNILHRSFSSVCDPRQVEDRWEAAGMITALNEALIQPLETPEPEPAAVGAELGLLLVMKEEDQKKMESRQEVEQQDKVSSAAD